MARYLFTDSEWNFKLINKVWEAIDTIAKKEFNLDYYKPQIEIVSAQQMLEVMSTHGLPIMYDHWSFGKTFLKNKTAYQKGEINLAYELIINTNPTIAYLMENNSMTMQTMVLCHAVCGHGGFFKNNYSFKKWTQADTIISYLKYARKFIKECEVKYGNENVSYLLDAAHALQLNGIDKYERSYKNTDMLIRKEEMREEVYSENYDAVYNSVFGNKRVEPEEWSQIDTSWERGYPEENLLYFIEKKSPILEPWQREVLRIVRIIAQYFYPQRQTKLMNEGYASFIHYELMTRLYDKKLITDGSYLEFLHSHSSVVSQSSPYFIDRFGNVRENPYYSGVNPYSLGYAMFRDIKRMCIEPTEEDLKWFPDICNTNWHETIDSVMKNYRDESFVLQFLSPKVIRDFKFMELRTKSDKYIVDATHGDEYIKQIRSSLASQYDLIASLPEINVEKVDWFGDRSLHLTHTVRNGVLLHYNNAKETMEYIYNLWGFPSEIRYVDGNGNEIEDVKSKEE